jgi:hypothetical protein
MTPPLPQRGTRDTRAPLVVRPDDPRLPEMRRQAAARLRPFRGEMPAEQFERLVRDVAMFRLRWFA